MKRRPATSTIAAATFGQVFEAEFRRHPLVIMGSVLIAAFVGGFSTCEALHEARASDPTVVCVIRDTSPSPKHEAAPSVADRQDDAPTNRPADTPADVEPHCANGELRSDS